MFVGGHGQPQFAQCFLAHIGGKMQKTSLRFGMAIRAIRFDFGRSRLMRTGAAWRWSGACLGLERRLERVKIVRPNASVHACIRSWTATARAKELRAQGLSLSKIGQRLRKERLTPLRGGIWHPAQVAELLRGAEAGDREAAARRASELRTQGMQLREIGVRLAVEGFLPKEGGIWPPSSVHALLASEESADRG